MKLFTGHVSLARFLLVVIVCGAVAVVWAVFSGSSMSDNSVRIEAAGAVMGKASTSGQPVSLLENSEPSPTPASLSLGEGQAVDLAQDGTNDAPVVTLNTPQAVATATPVTIQVYVTGAVAQPGVYSLPDGSRVQDAIAAAGGAMIQADLDDINLAQRLQDEAHITISRRDDAAPSSVDAPASSHSPASGAPIAGQSGPPGAKSVPSSPVNINIATSEELQTLPGIGPSLAARIVADRDQNGPYNSIEDLTRVPGIKEGIMSKIRAYITVAP